MNFTLITTLRDFDLFGEIRSGNTYGDSCCRIQDLYHMPYTRSLIGALAWSGLAYLVYKLPAGQRSSNSAAFLVGFAVFSHWLLDPIVHRPDLAIYDDTLKVAFGLWNYNGIEFAVV